MPGGRLQIQRDNLKIFYAANGLSEIFLETTVISPTCYEEQGNK